MEKSVAVDTDAGGLGPRDVGVADVANGTIVACVDGGWRLVAGIRKQRVATSGAATCSGVAGVGYGDGWRPAAAPAGGAVGVAGAACSYLRQSTDHTPTRTTPSQRPPRIFLPGCAAPG
jgi:hypothetical protein